MRKIHKLITIVHLDKKNMSSICSKGFKATFILMIYSAVIIFFSSSIHAGTMEQRFIKWAKDRTTSDSDLAKIQKVLVVVSPDQGVASEFYENVLTVELMANKISVVSQEKINHEQMLKLVEIENFTKKEESDTSQSPAEKKSSEESKVKLADLFAVGEATMADALVVVTLVASTVQRNIYANDPLRIAEVVDDLAVRASSVTVVEVSSGKLLIAGVMSYPDGTSLMEAAKNISEELINQLR